MNLRASADKLAPKLAGLIQRMPAEAAKALTFTAERVKKAEVAELRAKLDKPTPRTLSSVYLQMATPQRLEAVVWIVDELSGASKSYGTNEFGSAFQKTYSFNGITPDKWLIPHIRGGGRLVKGTEILLRKRGVIGPDQWLAIAANAPKNSYGNLSQGWYQKINAAFRANLDQYQNRTNSRRSRRNTGGIIMVLDDAGKPDFIAWRNAAGDLTPLLVVTKAPKYKARVDWYGVGKRVAADVLPRKVASAIRRANGGAAS